MPYKMKSRFLGRSTNKHEILTEVTWSAIGVAYFRSKILATRSFAITSQQWYNRTFPNDPYTQRLV